MSGRNSQAKNAGGADYRPTVKTWRAIIAEIIAWVGVAIVLAASWPTIMISREYMVSPNTAGNITEGVIGSFFGGVLGLFPALIGGFIARSRPAVWGIIAAGGVYLLAFLPWILADSSKEWLFGMPPGIICVTAGSALLATRHRGWWLALAVVAPIIACVGTVVIL